MNSNDILGPIFLIGSILAPVPFIYTYLKITSKRKIDKLKLTSNKNENSSNRNESNSLQNLCTLAEEQNTPNLVKNAFYITGMLTTMSGLLFVVFFRFDLTQLLIVVWIIIGVLFFLSGKSAFDHKGKMHNVASRLLIMFLVVGTSVMSYQIALDQFWFGMLLSGLIIIPAIVITSRALKLKFIDKISQVVFHLFFSFWNWLLCLYIIWEIF